MKNLAEPVSLQTASAVVKAISWEGVVCLPLQKGVHCVSTSRVCNTMSIGSMANVIGKYPTCFTRPCARGDAEVHALSRCQMILTEAKKRAQIEFEEVLHKTGLSTRGHSRI